GKGSTSALAAALDELDPPPGPKALIFASSRDKDWREILHILAPKFTHFIWTEFQETNRALPLSQLMESGIAFPSTPAAANSPREAWELALEMTGARRGEGAGGMICAAGSFFLAAAMRELMLQSVPSLRLV
ncbi:MAG TPA: hypothetical protein VNC50_05200, partial [Planctomycetia bacterium]|nr:hypothetical protein [Planctomycetia bacterium]